MSLCAALAHGAATDAPAQGASDAAVPAQGAAYRDAHQAIRIAGAQHGDYIIQGFNALYLQRHPDERFAPLVAGTGSAMPLLIYGRVLFAVMGRTATPAELQAYREANGCEPLEIRIAHTSANAGEDLSYSLGIYVNRANPVENLSVEQVNRMLSVGNPDGDYSRWGQAGLGGAWVQRRIHPYGTPESTGMGAYMQSAQLGQRPFAPAYEAHGSTAEILQRLEQDPAGVAFAGIGRANRLLKQVGIVTAPGRAPLYGSTQEVAAGAYPYGRYVYLYARRLPGVPLDPVAADYLKQVLSAAGQAVVAAQRGGYIALNDQEIQMEREKLK